MVRCTVKGGKMDKYNIPYDDGKKFRRKIFFKMLDSSNLGYIDGATDYCLLIPFAKKYDLRTKDRLWLAYLYGLSYSGSTAIRFFAEFPDINTVKPKKLIKFWESQKNTFWFNPDKKYLKNNDQVVPAIKSIYFVSEKDIEEYLIPYLKEGFDRTYKEIRTNWRFFGTHGAYLFFDALYGLLPRLYTNPTHLDRKNCGSTVKEGMAHLLYKDEAVGENNHNFDLYNKKVDLIVEKTGEPKVIIESTLCAFRKLFKRTRYFGYYADRMMEECIATEPYLKKLGIDIWDYREATIPEEFRGEIYGWRGIRKELYGLFLNEGVLYG